MIFMKAERFKKLKNNLYFVKFFNTFETHKTDQLSLQYNLNVFYYSGRVITINKLPEIFSNGTKRTFKTKNR